MALIDILNFEGEPMTYEVSRGNVGVISDIQGSEFNSIEIPVVLGGGDGDNIFIISE